jgi:hypothetical protein
LLVVLTVSPVVVAAGSSSRIDLSSITQPWLLAVEPTSGFFRQFRPEGRVFTVDPVAGFYMVTARSDLDEVGQRLVGRWGETMQERRDVDESKTLDVNLTVETRVVD